MHIDLTQSSPESAKKTKASKRLRFDEPAQEFVFKPRRPLTRNFQQVHEALPKTEEKEKETRPQQKGSKSKVTITSHRDYVATMKSQIEAAEEEINQLKKAAEDLKAELSRVPDK